MNIRQAQLPQGWEIKKLGEVCKLTNGYAFQSKEYTDDGYFVIRIGNVQDGYIELNNPRYIKLSEEKQKKFILSEGDILVSLTGNVGRVGEIKEEHLPAVLNQRVAKISLNSKSLQKAYLFYFLTSEYFITELIKAGRGAAQQNISTTDIENLIIPLPPLPEQQRIVSILDEAFAAIAKAKANAEQNLKNAKELFESYLQGVFENGNWETKTIQEITKVVNGYAFASKDFKPTNTVKSVKITNVGVKEFVEEADNYLPEKFKETLKDFQVKEGNIVIALTRTIISAGLKVAVVPASYDGALVNQRVAALVPNEKLVNQNFLYFYLTTSGVAKYVLEHVNTLMQPNLSINDLKNMPVPCPPLKDQQTIVRQLDALRAETQKLEAVYQQKIADLEELEKSVLQKAFKGELRSPEGVASANDGYSPSEKKTKNKISPERA